jgi:prolyl-tRNA editing enzyme YbaK/EbsC (Cys-tRNA(Pro) deacylase)
VPPVEHIEKLVTILDPGLKLYDRVWSAEGTPFAVFQLQSKDLEPLMGGVWVDLVE